MRCGYLHPTAGEGRGAQTEMEKDIPHSDSCGGCLMCICVGSSEKNYFFWTYFRQSRVTATRMMMPENTNCRLVSIPRVVRE